MKVYAIRVPAWLSVQLKGESKESVLLALQIRLGDLLSQRIPIDVVSCPFSSGVSTATLWPAEGVLVYEREEPYRNEDE